MLPSYPSPKHIGDKHIEDLLTHEVVVQEKVDGSQISFGVDAEGVLSLRSRGGSLRVDTPDKLFAPAVEYVRSIKDKLVPGWTYRGEAVCAPRHNLLKYNRTPKGFIALFDVYQPGTGYLTPEQLAGEALRLGFEAVTVLYTGKLPDPGVLQAFLNQESFLGGPKMEGYVIKNYTLANAHAEHFAGKVVSDAFKERRGLKTKSDHSDPMEALIANYTTEARWRKAVQHLREAGKITDTPADIGPIIKEVQADIEAECGDEIRAALYAIHTKALRGGFVRGLPEWYKATLAENATMPDMTQTTINTTD